MKLGNGDRKRKQNFIFSRRPSPASETRLRQSLKFSKFPLYLTLVSFRRISSERLQSKRHSKTSRAELRSKFRKFPKNNCILWRSKLTKDFVSGVYASVRQHLSVTLDSVLTANHVFLAKCYYFSPTQN